MNDEYTLTSPLAVHAARAGPLLGLTILWHPELDRIGQQHIGPPEAGKVELSRYLPMFGDAGLAGLPLGHRSVSRAPLTIARDGAGNVSISMASGRMAVTANGQLLLAAAVFTPEQVTRGLVLGLGGAILVCVHWMHGLPRQNALPGLLGVSSAAIRLRDQVRQAAAVSLPVLLLGETGTGKDLAARAIHAGGSRAGAPYVAVNMAALNESLAVADLFGAAKGAYTGAQQARVGLFGEADGGTLFLDEIGDTPQVIQPMLLRVLENGEYRPLGASRVLHANVRLIAATDQDLSARQFSPALLHRMEGFLIRLPPLRERREDIGLLLRHVLAEQGDAAVLARRLPAAFIEILCRQDWPGNVRQLAQVLRRALMAAHSGEALLLETFIQMPAPTPPAPVPSAIAARSTRIRLEELAPQEVARVLRVHGWQIQPAARELGISRPSLYKLLAMYPQLRRNAESPT
ncbi:MULTISPECIES: sigma 54-interacting transcriptional regulator [unclassified Duganella]|uniref:sigma 54-interacting transcriptional regulator n=1 Tax=unclassified Duganella TaxID=2636909 RepID=UPI000880D4E0|nr:MULTISPECIES: sigma 54-interacting transcriptional regulator [unclassified Duganella]SDF58688.1 two-component system, NtrC family, nitrogen regulation response regulator GlnG [Duganella sp. OV458]SDI69914.1 two-component system, NtrC family, nitrogen regulation response regulator GlnG [Duganella sp. OV510]